MDNKLSILTSVSGSVGLTYGITEITSLIGQIAAMISGIAIILNIILSIIKVWKGADKNKDGKIDKNERNDAIDKSADAIETGLDKLNKLKSNDKDGD